MNIDDFTYNVYKDNLKNKQEKLNCNNFKDLGLILDKNNQITPVVTININFTSDCIELNLQMSKLFVENNFF